MDEPALEFVLRTPHAVVLQTAVRALRVPTETGQVGLRPRGEATVLAVEAGIVNLRRADGVTFAGTAGGLLTSDGRRSTLLTPLAVVGADAAEIAAELQRALAEPNSELEARATLSKLEGRILQELRQERKAESQQRQGGLP